MLFSKFFKTGKTNQKTTNRPQVNRKAVEEFINSYNENDMYYKVAYYDTTCGKWKEGHVIYNTRQQAYDAINSILFNCHISRDLFKIKSYTN